MDKGITEKEKLGQNFKGCFFSSGFLILQRKGRTYCLSVNILGYARAPQQIVHVDCTWQ